VGGLREMVIANYPGKLRRATVITVLLEKLPSTKNAQLSPKGPKNARRLGLQVHSCHDLIVAIRAAGSQLNHRGSTFLGKTWQVLVGERAAGADVGDGRGL
jgi:hypothetical protein